MSKLNKNSLSQNARFQVSPKASANGEIPGVFDQNIGMNFGKDALHTPYPIFFYTLHTHPYLSLILRFSVKDVKAHPLRLLEAQHAAPLLADSPLNHQNQQRYK